MMNFQLPDPEGGPLRVLCLGAHADDIEIGAGATLLSLLSGDRDLAVHWTVFSASGVRGREAAVSASQVLGGVKNPAVEILGFTDGYFPSETTGIKEHFETINSRFQPDVIFTHRERDRHQDHRVVSELTWNTFRNHLILEYEVPKYDGDLGHPNLFAPVSPQGRARKISLLMDTFSSQVEKHWFTPETFDSLMRIRGIESASPTGYAEAFYLRKGTLVLQPSQP